MSRKLLAVDLVLLVACALFVALMIRTSRTPWPEPGPARQRPPAAAEAPVPPAAESAPGAYSTIAARNLFSPTRSEAPPTPVVAVATLPKPNLFGVVVREGASIAYLEDPVTKRVAGYRQGDAIAGGTVQTIASDRVVLARPEGNVDVRLHDPSKPRPPAPPATPAGGTPRAAPGAPSAATPGQPSAPPTVEAPAGGRRPLPPNLLRRLPPGANPAPQPGANPAPQPEAGNAPQH
jgi:hypothetical protein